MKPWIPFYSVIMPSAGAFHLTPHNQTTAFNSCTRKAFILLLEIFIFAHEKPAGDCCYV
jgi:hypothetical protein